MAHAEAWLAATPQGWSSVGALRDADLRCWRVQWDHTDVVAEPLHVCPPEALTQLRLAAQGATAFWRTEPQGPWRHTTPLPSDHSATIPGGAEQAPRVGGASITPLEGRVVTVDEQGNAREGLSVVLDSSRNLIINRGNPGSVVAVAGLSDMVVCVTPQATLVVPIGDAQRVKELVALVSEQVGPELA